MYQKITEAKNYLKQLIKDTPNTGIIIGSGLDKITKNLENKIVINYSDIPHFISSKVKGHNGKLIYGKKGKNTLIVLDGRNHHYEGYTMKEISFPIYVLKELGINSLIITNSCGGINKNFTPGDLMIIDDFINLISSNPLIGENDDRLGKRFPDMTEPYSRDLMNKLKKTFEKLNINYKTGVYAGFQGPYYETRAEIKMIGILGADAVGMSTVPETIAANYLGIKVLGLSLITNMATGIKKEKHSHESVLETAKKSSDKICILIDTLLNDYKL